MDHERTTDESMLNLRDHLVRALRVLLMAAFLATSLAACGGSDNDSGDTGQIIDDGDSDDM